MPYSPYAPMFQQYQQMMQPQISNAGSFVSVPNEMTARNYPIAPGNSVTFIDENSPYCYTKTMGLNQLDRPIFKRYKLVEEQETVSAAPQSNGNTQSNEPTSDKIQGEIQALRAMYERLDKEVNELKERNDHGKPSLSITAETSE